MPTPQTVSHGLDVQLGAPFFDGRLQALFKFDGEQWFGLTDNGDALGDEIKVVLKGFQAAFGRWGCRKGQEGTEQAGGLELGC